MLWVAKISGTLALVWLASYVMRRWGGLLAGMLVGFPVMTAPVAFFMAFEQGTDFGARSAVGIMLALSGVSAFAVAYATLARTGVRWPAAMAAAVAVYFVVSSLAIHLTDHPAAAAAWTFAVVAAGLAVLGRPAAPPEAFIAPWWDVWLRMAITALIVVAVTAAAGALGPKLSAVPATYPAVTSIVAPFVHARSGADAASAVMRGVLLSHISFVVLFAVVAALIETSGVAAAYACGLAASLGVSAMVIAADRRLQHRARR